VVQRELAGVLDGEDLARGGTNIDTAFIEVVFPEAVPPANDALLCSIQSQNAICSIENAVLHQIDRA